MHGDVNGVISLDQGAPEPECVWSIRFHNGRPSSSSRRGGKHADRRDRIIRGGSSRAGTDSPGEDGGVTGSTSSGSGSGHSSSSDDAPSPPVASGTTHGSARPPAATYSGSAGGGQGAWPDSNSNYSPPRSEDSNDSMEVVEGDADSE